MGEKRPKKRSKRYVDKRIVVEFNEASRSKFINSFKGCKKKRKKIALKQKQAKEKTLKQKYKLEQRKQLLERLDLLKENNDSENVNTNKQTVKTLHVSNNIICISDIDLTNK